MPSPLSSALFSELLQPGAVISATVPISESVLNQLALDSGARVFDIRVSSGNNIKAAVKGPFGLTIPLDVTIVSIDRSLRSVLEFNGFLVRKALMLVAAWLPQVARVESGRLHVAIGSLPQLAAYRPLFTHLQSVSVNTQPGMLVLELKVVVQ